MTQHPSIPEVIMYTDGAALGNPGPGGYGVVLKSGHLRKEISGGFKLTTNNRMELLAVIKGLEALRRSGTPVQIFTDSRYVHDAVEKGWLWNWQRKGWAGKKNIDLWKAFIPLYKQHHVKFHWVKGHAGIPENERCDVLATQAAYDNPFEEDHGYKPEEPSLL